MSEGGTSTNPQAFKQGAVIKNVVPEDPSDPDKKTPSPTQSLEPENETLDPVVKKLVSFLKDSSRKEMNFSGDLSSHEVFLVHKFVQEHGLTCESTGDNANHKFVVVKGDGFAPDEEQGCDNNGNNVDEGAVDENCVEVDSCKEDRSRLDTNRSLNKNGKSAINSNITLRALKLHDFSGIYKTGTYDELLESLENICQAVDVTFRLDENVEMAGSKQNIRLFRVSLFINDVHVSDGYSEELLLAKQNALQVTFSYLKDELGLSLYTFEECHNRYARLDSFENELNDEEKFRDNFFNYLELEFLNRCDIQQLRVVAKFQFVDENQWQRKIVVEVAQQFKLRTDIIRNKVIYLTKVNSILHKLNVLSLDKQNLLNLTGNPPNRNDQNAPGATPNMVTYILSGTRMLRDGWDREKVNVSIQHVRLVKLDKFQGVVPKDKDSVTALREIATMEGVRCRFEYSVPSPNEWSARLFINKIYVAKDVGDEKEAVTSEIANNAFRFLISKGLKVVFEDDVCAEQIKEVKREDVDSSSLQQHFSSFLQDQMLLMMKFCFPFASDEKELISTLCKKHSLDCRCEEEISLISVLKRNSKKHNMMVLTPGVKHDCTPSSKPSTYVVTSEELAKKPSISKHIKKFVNCKSIKEMIFPVYLEDSQRELVQELALKYRLLLRDKSSMGLVLLKRKVPPAPQKSQKQAKRPRLKNKKHTQFGDRSTIIDRIRGNNSLPCSYGEESRPFQSTHPNHFQCIRSPSNSLSLFQNRTRGNIGSYSVDDRRPFFGRGLQPYRGNINDNFHSSDPSRSISPFYINSSAHPYFENYPHHPVSRGRKKKKKKVSQ